MLRKGQIRWLQKKDIAGQLRLSIACSAWLRDPHDLTFTRAYSIVFATLLCRRLTDPGPMGRVQAGKST
jgi:hypothetical protein